MEGVYLASVLGANGKVYFVPYPSSDQRANNRPWKP